MLRFGYLFEMGFLSVVYSKGYQFIQVHFLVHFLVLRHNRFLIFSSQEMIFQSRLKHLTVCLGGIVSVDLG